MALNRGLQEEGSLSQEIAALGDFPLDTVADGLAICAALRKYADSLAGRPAATLTCDCSKLHPLASLFQEAETDEVFQVLQEHGLPVLLEVFDLLLPKAVADEGEDLVFLLKIFVVYGYEPGVHRISQALRQPLDPDLYVWGVLFETIHDEHPQRQLIVDELRNPLPTGFAGISYLDLINRLAEKGEALPHPFDSDTGISILQNWATSQLPEESSYAQSVAFAIPYLQHPERETLLDLIAQHDDPLVRVDAAHAAARIGRTSGVNQLIELCEDASVSYFACLYLRALGREDAIPEMARNPHFMAVAEMCAWLSQPDAYGEIPDEIEIFDHRVAHWPPTQDQRPLWLLKYTYAADPSDPDDYPETGIGLVGSETCVLFDVTLPDQSPEEIYALHCCQELQSLGDECAPAEISIEAGKKALGWS